jgi:UDP-N-acetylmuramate: L-alanyl-gamma-D-glutamyl-meso-diaminopimelate ligase
MRQGVHRHTLLPAMAEADIRFLLVPDGIDWLPDAPLDYHACPDVDTLLAQLLTQVHPGDTVLIMSNGGFGQLHQRLLDALPEIVYA